MTWLGTRVHLAVERSPTAWTLVAAERSSDRVPRCVTGTSIEAEPASVSEDLRQFRVRERLPSEATLVLWPEAGDAGVATLDARVDGVVSLPKAKVMRQRVAPFVRAGGQVREVLLPHEAAGRLAALAAWPSACVLLLQPTAACLAVVEGESVQASYLSWVPDPAAVGESQRLLGRYQFAARLMPHLIAWAGRAPDARMAVCGRFPDLRSAMVPIVEELDREVDVLDASLLGQSADDAADPSEVSARQLAWALAAGH